MEEGVVNDDPVWSGGVKGGKVSVPRGVAIEVGIRECLSMEGSCIDGGVFCPSSL